MPCMFAYALLKNRVDNQTVSKWNQLAAGIDPDRVYHSNGNNWGIVALTGEVSLKTFILLNTVKIPA